MLNPKLFRLLEQHFGRGNVRLLKEDTPLEGEYTVNAMREERRQRLEVAPHGSGEEYRVNCPFCTDTRRRLSINHRWGLFDRQSRSRNLWLAQCFNEQCLTSYENQRALYDRVFSRADNRDWELEKPTKTRAPRKVKLTAPGSIWSLVDMQRRSPRHPALRYLQDRLLDPGYLSRVFRVGYLVDADDHFLQLAAQRIYAPIYFRGQQRGWTARFVGDAPHGTPKWYHCPGMDRATLLYNYDQGIQHQTKVLVEGPPAVWGFGRQAMALLGKVITGPQIDLLEESMQPDDTIVLLLDPDQSEDDRQRQRPHHIETAYDVLTRRRRLKERVIKVYLPPGRDPADLTRDYMRQLIRCCAAQQRLPVSFVPRRVEVSS